MVYLAADLSASSWRLVKGHRSGDGRILTETVLQSSPGAVRRDDGTLLWDLEALSGDIIRGMKAAGKADSFSVTGWGSDFVLLDESGSILGDAVSYMDGRTERLESVPESSYVFSRTGMQERKSGTLYQLLAIRQEHPELLEKAAYLLFIPDYIGYRLTGVIKHEYSYAAATGLVDPETHTWDYELIRNLSLPVHLFTELSDPGTSLGHLKPEISAAIGYDPEVVLSPSERSAAALLGMPLQEDDLFLLSGSRSSIGCIASSPAKGTEAFEAGISNEGGTAGTVKVSADLEGAALLERLRDETGLSDDEIAAAVRQRGVPGTFDPSLLTGSGSLPEEVAALIGKEDTDAGDAAAAVCSSLSLSVCRAAGAIGKATGRSFGRIVAAGSLAASGFILDLIAMHSGMTVVSESMDAPLMGNLMSQMITSGEISPGDRAGIVRKSSFMTSYRRI